MKSQPVSTRLYSAKTSLTEIKQSDLDLREQVRRLEAENSELRYRLDSLRKAKNQLIVKRDKPEYSYFSPVRTLPIISTPKPSMRESYSLPTFSVDCRNDSRSSLASSDELKVLELEKAWRVRLEETERNLLLDHEEEVKQLEKEKRQLRGEVEQIRLDKSELLIDFERKEAKWADELQRRECDSSRVVASREGEYEELVLRCRQLERLGKEQELRVDNLLAENSYLRRAHGQREEEWKLREDELSLEIRKAWGQRYHEWITKAEKKMQELQEMNRILQEMVDGRVTELSEKKYSKH